MPNTRSTPRPTKRRKTILIVIALLIATPLFLVAYNYIDMRINKPLGTGSDFLFIKQETVRSPFISTESFYYATDVPPEEFASKFEGWRTGSLTGGESYTHVKILDDSNRRSYALYYTKGYLTARVSHVETPVTDFKNRKYIVKLYGTSMYYLNPSNIHWSMKDQIQQDIQRNYIR